MPRGTTPWHPQPESLLTQLAFPSRVTAAGSLRFNCPRWAWLRSHMFVWQSNGRLAIDGGPALSIRLAMYGV